MFDHCLYFNTSALARVLDREWSRAFKPFGLTPPQAFMLRAVLAQPGLLQNQLAQALVVSRPTATRSLQGLQELGLLERRSTGGDARECAIHPTKAALALRKDLDAASGEVTKKLKKLLGEDGFSNTVSQLKEVRSALG
jgi:DNA-binding MarR family transcriptional regulator